MPAKYVRTTLSVLMQETFKVASYDDTIMMRTKQKAMQNHIKKMQLLFEEADTSEDGKIDLDEFKEILADSELKAWLGAMELDIRDVSEAWELLQDDCNDRTGGLTAEQLVLGVARLQGTAKSLDLMKVIKEQNSIKQKMDRLEKGIQSLRCNTSPGFLGCTVISRSATYGELRVEDRKVKSIASNPPSPIQAVMPSTGSDRFSMYQDEVTENKAMMDRAEEEENKNLNIRMAEMTSYAELSAARQGDEGATYRIEALERYKLMSDEMSNHLLRCDQSF
eukprot:s894_g13.t1